MVIAAVLSLISAWKAASAPPAATSGSHQRARTGTEVRRTATQAANTNTAAAVSADSPFTYIALAAMAATTSATGSGNVRRAAARSAIVSAM